jgi:hypothetical protein
MWRRRPSWRPMGSNLPPPLASLMLLYSRRWDTCGCASCCPAAAFVAASATPSRGPAPVAPPRHGAAAQPPDHGRGPPGADQQDRGAAPVPLPPRVPPSQDRGGRRPLPPALPTAGFDPLDPDVSSPPRALSPAQVSLCKKAHKLLGKKLKHPYALSKDFWSLPVCNSLPHSPSPSPYSDCSTKLSAAPNGSLRLSNID